MPKDVPAHLHRDSWMRTLAERFDQKELRSGFQLLQLIWTVLDLIAAHDKFS